jgi:hypothetical protein
MHFDLGDSTPAKPEPNAAAAEPAPNEATSSDSISEEFQNDPLIKSALEKFKLKIAARS